MQLELFEAAHGPCEVCGTLVETKAKYFCSEERRLKPGSTYWAGMTEKQWDILRPLVTHMFKPDMVQNVLFVPQLCKPLCSPECSLKHKEKT